MKKYVVKGKGDNCGLNYDNYDEAIEILNKILRNEANHLYNRNKNHVFLLGEVKNINDNEDDYEEENLNIIISLSVREYREMSDNEKKEKGLY